MTNSKQRQVEGQHITAAMSHQRYLIRIETYKQTPNLCAQCYAPLAYSHRKNKFCSHSCAAIVTNRLFPKRQQTNGTREYRRQGKWRKQFRKKRLRDLTLLEYLERTHVKPLPAMIKKSALRSFARHWNQDILKKPCANCGYDKHVQLAHIKAIRDFPLTATLGEINSRTNVIQLCPNCHWEFDNTFLKISVGTEGFEPSISRL